MLSLLTTRYASNRETRLRCQPSRRRRLHSRLLRVGRRRSRPSVPALLARGCQVACRSASSAWRREQCLAVACHVTLGKAMSQAVILFHSIFIEDLPPRPVLWDWYSEYSTPHPRSVHAQNLQYETQNAKQHTAPSPHRPKTAARARARSAARAHTRYSRERSTRTALSGSNVTQKRQGPRGCASLQRP